MKNFRPLLFTVLTLGSFASCKKDPVPKTDAEYCEEALNTMTSSTFRGEIRLCNAQPPDAAWLSGSADIAALGNNEISIHVKSDTNWIDTTLTYLMTCEVVEDTIPIIQIQDTTGADKGQFDRYSPRIEFSFGYKNCLHNTSFEGRQ